MRNVEYLIVEHDIFPECLFWVRIQTVVQLIAHHAYFIAKALYHKSVCVSNGDNLSGVASSELCDLVVIDEDAAMTGTMV